MRLADDARGRVPFALVGVVLLLGSTAYASGLAPDGPRIDRDADVAMDRSTAAAETALRTAVARAAREAAHTPVAAPASNGWGDVIDDSRPFRDALRIRVYVAARDAFERAAYTHGDVRAAASLPATPTPAALDRALDRVSIRGVENGTALEVTVENVSVVARSNGRVVARETANWTVTVATPVLALHDRTVRFERSLDRGPLAGPGLGRQLTARLYPLAYARGFGQWAGLPIGNVVGTRHVGASTNGAVLDLQRSAFGRADPTARARYGRALSRLALRDLSGSASTPATDLATSAAPPPTVDPDDASARLPTLSPATGPAPDTERTVGINGSADEAFVALHEPGPPPTLDAVLERAYRVNLTLRTAVTPVSDASVPDPDPPGPDADLVNESVRTWATAENGSATLPPLDENATRLRTARRRVAVHHEVERVWERGTKQVVTTETVTETYAVGVAVDGRLPPLNGTPVRPIDPLFERGGALDGPNFADVPAEADAFLEARGGADGVAETRLLDGAAGLDRHETVVADRPEGLREWVSADVLALHRRTRNLSTAVALGDAAAGRANPSRRLAGTLAERRERLLDAPGTYDGAADRARVAARAAYLAAVRDRLTTRSDATRAANEALASRLDAAGIDLDGRATRIMRTRSAARPDATPVAGSLGGADVFVPQGGPPYLDVEGVDAGDAAWTDDRGTSYPLETRNVNLFTVPYGDAADAVVGAASGPDGVRLHTAAATLRAAERASGNATVATASGADGGAEANLTAERERLRGAVSDSLDAVRRRVERVLGRETDLSPAERERVVETALSTWERPSVRALAVANGSVVPRVVAAADAEGAAATRLRIRLRVAVAEARESGSTRVPEETVDTAADAVRRVSETAASEALGTATDRAVDRLKQRADGRAAVVPAGLPLLPTPTNWYATVNVWEVRVRGEYPRFAVRTARGAPGETVTYVRDGGAATLDVDDDGNAERLGRAERIEFAVRTVVLVGVPPYRTGVGDVDGQAVETSPGWNASDAGASDVSGAVVAASGSKRPGRTAAAVGDRRE